MAARLDSWAEHLSTSLVGVRRQVDAEKRAVDRRFQQLERQLQAALGRLEGGGDCLRDSSAGLREKWAELHGSVTGLMEEVQALARRADSVDDRLWARASGAEELARSGTRDLQQQVHSVERQGRLLQAAWEDAQRRQQAKQRRADQLMEDFEWRLAKLEDGPGQGDEVEAPTVQEEQLQGLCAEVEALQARVAAVEALHAKPSNNSLIGMAADSDDRSEAAEASARLVETRLSAVETRVNTQLEELRAAIAAARVKVDSHGQRQASIAERLESAHVPTLEVVRSETAAERVRDLRVVEDRIAELGRKVDLALEATEASQTSEQEADSIGHRTAAVEASTAALHRELQELRSSLRREVRALANHHGRPFPRSSSGTSTALAEPTIREQLGAVADQLEALEELMERVGLMEGRLLQLEERLLQGSEDGEEVQPAEPPSRAAATASELRPSAATAWEVQATPQSTVLAKDSATRPATRDVLPASRAANQPMGQQAAAAAYSGRLPSSAPSEVSAPKPEVAAPAPQPQREEAGAVAGEGRKLAEVATGTTAVQQQPAEDEEEKVERVRSSWDSVRSVDIANSPDESVDDTLVLETRCDACFDVMRPDTAGPGGAAVPGSAGGPLTESGEAAAPREAGWPGGGLSGSEGSDSHASSFVEGAISENEDSL